MRAYKMTLEDRRSSVNVPALTRVQLSEEAVLARDSNEHDAVRKLVRDTANDVTAKRTWTALFNQSS